MTRVIEHLPRQGKLEINFMTWLYTQASDCTKYKQLCESVAMCALG
jgi:hypothetical protein